jgi:hypothetical protein
LNSQAVISRIQKNISKLLTRRGPFLLKMLHFSIALHGTETWTFPAVDQKHMEILKCGVGEGWRRKFGPIL